jgi:hypothetical protein
LAGIRILLVGLKPLLSDLLEPLLDAERVVAVFDRCAEHEVLRRTRDTRPDVVVFCTGTATVVPRCVFDAHPSAKIVCIETTSGRAFLQECIGDVAPRELVDAICSAGAGRAR